MPGPCGCKREAFRGQWRWGRCRCARTGRGRPSAGAAAPTTLDVLAEDARAAPRTRTERRAHLRPALTRRGISEPPPPRARTSTAVVPGACGGRTLCTSSLADATSPGTLRRSQPEGPAQAPALAGTQRHGHTGCCSGPGTRTPAAGAGGAGASALLTRQPETRGSPLTSQTPRFTRKPRTRDTPRSRLHLITAKRTLTGDGLGGPKLQAPLSSLWGQDTSPLPPMLPSQRAQNPAAQRSQRHPPSASPILMCHNVPGTRLRLRVTSRAG